MSINYSRCGRFFSTFAVCLPQTNSAEMPSGEGTYIELQSTITDGHGQAEGQRWS